MKVEHRIRASQRPSVIAIGMFDGVHVGHRKILAAAGADARKGHCDAEVFTFEQHPQTVMKQRQCVAMITTTRQKLRLFDELGIDRTLVVPFNRAFSRTGPEDFVRRVLLGRLRMRELCVGYDFAFGRDRTGNLSLLGRLSRQWGFALRIFPPITRQGIVVSSTTIRRALKAGRLELARKLLGRWYAMEGVVEKGLGLGKSLGFPTANLRMENDTLLPDGVYAVWAKGLGRSPRPGVLNVGLRPTLAVGKRKARTWELYLWDFDKDLYGRRLEIAFVKRLRPEKKFSSLAALSAQIGRDIQRAKKMMAGGRNLHHNK